MRDVFTFVLCLCIGMSSAQFQFFENMFGGHHQQQQQQRSGASQWATYSDSVSCSHYLCPETLDCVQRPIDCPCPNMEDIKCTIPDKEGRTEDATVVCVRGANGCSEVERLVRKGFQEKY
ncbi:long chronological lifespan protein 2 [Cyathus striatus]|nr:long chronological lifespan protein 2 [Cyathus striatus]